MTTTRHILTSKICKLFFQIALKNFLWVRWWYCGYSKHPLILSLSNDNKNIGIGCVYQNIFKKRWPTPRWGGGQHLQCNFDCFWRDLSKEKSLILWNHRWLSRITGDFMKYPYISENHFLKPENHQWFCWKRQKSPVIWLELAKITGDFSRKFCFFQKKLHVIFQNRFTS